VFAFDWLGMGASARPSFEAADQDAAETFFLEVLKKNCYTLRLVCMLDRSPQGFSSMRRDLGLHRFVFAGHR
jgi:hypothetical protein